jgi:hypothetical protein
LCTACGQKWGTVAELSAATKYKEGEKTIVGARWCYSGPHSFLPIAAGDDRVVRSTNVSLCGGAELQSKINTLASEHSKVKNLTIRDQFFDEKNVIELDCSLPNLQVLIVDGIKLSKLVVTDENMPSVKKLVMINVGCIDNMTFRVNVSKIEDLTIHFMDSDDISIINTMLKAATRLVKFECYKLWVHDGMLKFASNYLEKIWIRRSDCLTGISIWAPRLKSLSILGCFDLQKVEILEDHPLKSMLKGSSANKLSSFSLDLTNSVQPADKLYKKLAKHPRVHSIVLPEDDGF